MNEPTVGWSPQRTPSLSEDSGAQVGGRERGQVAKLNATSGPGSPPAWLETQLVEVWLWPGAEGGGCG